MNNIIDWAKREVEIAKERENLDNNLCNEAIEALEKFCDGLPVKCNTKLSEWMFNRLIHWKPLTSIEDIGDVWEFKSTDEKGEHYECNRARGLYKDVLPNEDIVYTDIYRYVCVSKDNPILGWHNGFVHSIYNEMYPLIMPYMPTDVPDKIFCEQFLTDPKNGDYDTFAILYIEHQNGEKVEVNRYFKDSDISYEEISLDEFNERKKIVRKRNKRLAEVVG